MDIILVAPKPIDEVILNGKQKDTKRATEK